MLWIIPYTNNKDPEDLTNFSTRAALSDDPQHRDAPGKERGPMIDFIYKVNELLPVWPVDEKWTPHKIAEETDTSLPHVLQYLNEGLGKEIELGTTISNNDIHEAVGLLKKRYRDLIEEREKRKAERQQKAIRAFDIVMGKVRVMQSYSKWNHAYKTLCYFAGQYESELPREYLTTVCSDIIRMGIKARVNIQEISRWLQKGVSIAMSHQNRDGIAEALDFIDAYGEYFLNEDTGKGALLLGNILAVVEEPSARHELWEEYKGLVNQLYPIT